MNLFFLLGASFLLSVFLTFALIKIGIRYHLCDAAGDGVLKIHKKPIPYLGGSAIFLSIIIVFFFEGFFEEKFNLIYQILGIILGGLVIFCAGFLDDFKWKNLSQPKPYLKLFSLIFFSLLASFILLCFGIKIQFFPGIILAGFFTFFYILGLINTINFEDGMDGLAGGLVSISLIGFILLSFFTGNNLSMIISLAVLAAILGFLIFNFPPAKIFMGDSGAYFLGFVLAVLAMVFSRSFDLKSLIGPIFIIGLPIFDTAQVILTRFLQKQSIFLGTRNHFYDILHFKRKIPIRETVLICYCIQAIFVMLGFLIYL